MRVAFQPIDGGNNARFNLTDDRVLLFTETFKQDFFHFREQAVRASRFEEIEKLVSNEPGRDEKLDEFCRDTQLLLVVLGHRLEVQEVREHAEQATQLKENDSQFKILIFFYLFLIDHLT